MSVPVAPKPLVYGNSIYAHTFEKKFAKLAELHS